MRNRTRRRLQAAWIGTLLGIILGVGANQVWGPDWGVTVVYAARTLTASSPSDFADLAQDHVRVFHMMDGTPQVLASRYVTASELPCFGLSPIYVQQANEALVLVILKGDFTLSDRPAPLIITPSGFHYLAYVYYVRDHGWTASTASRTGLEFRRAIGDAAVETDGTPLPPLPVCTPAATMPGVQPTFTAVPAP